MVPHWFLYLNGFAMLILGVAMMVLRPHAADDSRLRRFGNWGTLWAGLCCTVGALLLAMALGYLSWNRRSPIAASPSRWQVIR